MRVFDTGDGRCRFEWITDVAPDSWAIEQLGGEYMDMLWSELVTVLETGEEAPWPAAAAD